MSDICKDCKYWDQNKKYSKWGDCQHPKCLTNWYDHKLRDGSIYRAMHSTARYQTNPACKTRFEERPK